MESAVEPIEILLVEDSPGDADLAREALEGAKVRNNLHVAADGVEARPHRPSSRSRRPPTARSWM